MDTQHRTNPSTSKWVRVVVCSDPNNEKTSHKECEKKKSTITALSKSHSVIPFQPNRSETFLFQLNCTKFASTTTTKWHSWDTDWFLRHHLHCPGSWYPSYGCHGQRLARERLWFGIRQQPLLLHHCSRGCHLEFIVWRWRVVVAVIASRILPPRKSSCVASR